MTEQTREAVDAYVMAKQKQLGDYLFESRGRPDRCISSRQYSRLVSSWIGGIGLDPQLFGTHSFRRTKATLIYRRTGNLRAVQLLLGALMLPHKMLQLPPSSLTQSGNQA